MKKEKIIVRKTDFNSLVKRMRKIFPFYYVVYIKFDLFEHGYFVDRNNDFAIIKQKDDIIIVGSNLKNRGLLNPYFKLRKK